MRHTGIDVIGDVQWGTHFCQFYEGSQDLVETLVPYFKEGLASNEFCMWVTSEPLEVRQAKAALRKAVPNLDKYIRKGQIEIIDYKDWYVRSGKFSADKVLKGWVDKLAAALDKGFEGLRLSGNTFWLEKANWEDFRRYEEAVNSVIGRYKMLAICTYSLEKCGAMEILDVVANHEFALVKRQGKWEIIQSTAQKQTEQELKQAREHLENLLDYANAPIIVWDPRFKITRFNHAFERLTGLKSDEVIGRPLDILFPRASRGESLAHIKRTLAGERWEVVEIPILRTDGLIRTVLWNSANIYDKDGTTITATIAQGQDITERKEAEVALRKERDFSSAVLDTAGVLVIVLDREGRITRFNRACEAMTGYSEAEVLGRVFWEFLVSEEDLSGVKRTWEALQAGDFPNKYENKWVAKDGSKRLIAWSNTAMVRPDGRVEHIIGTGVDITESRKAEASIKYQALLLGQVHDGIVGADPDTRITYWNKGAEHIYGFTEKEALGRHTQELLRPAYSPGERENILDELAHYGMSEATIRTQHKNGTMVIAEVHSARMTDESGATSGYVIAYRDVTERETAEDELRRTRSHLENLINYANAPIIVWDPSFNITRFNHAFERLTGLKSDEVIGRPLDILFPEATRAESLAHITRTLAGERWEVVEIPILRTDGSVHTVLWNSANIYDEDGTTITATIAQGQDITERKDAEQALQLRSQELQKLTETLEQRVQERTAELAKSNDLLKVEINHSRMIEADLNRQRETLQTLIDNIPVMLCFYDSSGRTKLINREFERLLGWSKEEAEVLDIAPAKIREAAGIPLAEVSAAQGIPGWREHVLKTRKGVDLESSWATVRLSDGGQIGIGIDMRERRAAEVERLRLAAAIGQVVEGMAITDAGGHIEYLNPAFEKTSGFGRAELLGKRYYDLLVAEGADPALGEQAQRIVGGGESWNAHLIRKQRGEQTCELDIRITPIRDRSGNIINYLVIERDVTHEVRLQQHLRQTQKMEALGTLAGGIAHDFNNILNPIFINTELVLMDAALDHVARRDLETVLKAAERGRDLVKQIITFSRQKEKERKPSKVGPVIIEALKFLRSSMPVTIEIRQKIEPESGFILADPSQIHQVVMNLGNNAAYAMRERGGVLDVSLREVEVDKDMAMRHPDLRLGAYLRLTVGDTGQGMTPEVMERAFDPFFTTKKHGEGSGLGLSSVHGIVRDYDGAVTVYSEVGKGTTFNVFFPRVPAAEIRPEGEVESLPKGTERILLVDDEKTQAQSIRNMLTRLGYQVEVKTDAEEALATFRKDPGRFDLVITDQIMPRLTGVQLATQFLQLQPGLPIILCTGFSENVDSDGARAMGIRGFLMKPFSIREMAGVIKKALGK